MKKVSTASFVIAIILIVCAIVFNILGFVDMCGTHVARHYGNGFMQVTYTMTSTASYYVSLGMIITGGFMFLGGILLFMLSVLTCHRPPKGHGCCGHHHRPPMPEEEFKAEQAEPVEPQQAPEAAPEAEPEATPEQQPQE